MNTWGDPAFLFGTTVRHQGAAAVDETVNPLNGLIDQFLNRPCTLSNCADTWRAWFRSTLEKLLTDPTHFDGKRPGCNSDWKEHLADALSLIDPKVVDVWKEDEDGVPMPHVINQERYDQLCRMVLVRLIPRPLRWE
jgi:hypothetical protein